MKEKVNLKAVISIFWFLVGIAAIVVGLLIKTGDVSTKVLGITMSTSSNTAVATALFESSRYGAMITLKYIIIAAGAIIAAVSSIGFAGAIQVEKLENLIYDDVDYDAEELEGCDCDCASCEDAENCEGAEFEEAEEAIEETVEETVEESTEQ